MKKTELKKLIKEFSTKELERELKFAVSMKNREDEKIIRKELKQRR